MTERPSKEDISRLAEQWEPGDQFYEAFDDLKGWADEVGDVIQKHIDSAVEKHCEERGKFAAELAADISAHQEIHIHEFLREEDDQINGFCLYLFDMEGEFGVPREEFSLAEASLSVLIKDHVSKESADIRRQTAAYLRKLADEIEQKETA